MNKHSNPLDYLIECCETAISTGHWQLDKFTVINAKDELEKLRQSKRDLVMELYQSNQAYADLLNQSLS